ncbi:MAG TPA: hypothetical protein VEU08_06485 [Vicinamibacterales bacterium]|nr:hypothetical protein [Vicinamibacterales bacterium]
MRRLCTVLVALGAMAAPHAQTTPTLADLLVKAAAYSRDLQLQMAKIICDEDYEQVVTVGRKVVHRRIQAEMLFWWLDDERVWLSIRNVLRVDGLVIADSKDRLEHALAESVDPPPEGGRVSRSARLRRLQEESARYDIGTVRRTTSDPAGALHYMVEENQHHFAFTREREESVSGTHAWKLAFREVERPTVMRYDQREIPASGAVWVRASDGVIVRTEWRATLRRGFTAEIAVEFRQDPKLTLWLPERMEEKYGRDLVCRSRYSNYRRFETSGRIVGLLH